ncbi:MAG: hypothetical protein IPK80_18600 [Nannocystis sp.]|nr:hypothetical protein [Nannocystis sp.]
MSSAAATITSIAELPFPLVDPFALLGFQPGRREPDLDYAGYGRAHLPSIDLIDEPRGAALRVERPHLFALHSADDGPELDADIELEFWFDRDTSITCPLSLFLRRRAPALLRGADPLVLALCNPYRAELRRPLELGDRPLYYALGDVIAHLDAPEGAPWDLHTARISLQAPAWRRL